MILFFRNQKNGRSKWNWKTKTYYRTIQQLLWKQDWEKGTFKLIFMELICIMLLSYLELWIYFANYFVVLVCATKILN